MTDSSARGLRKEAEMPRAAFEVLAAGSSWPLDVAPGDNPAQWSIVADTLLEAAVAGGADECVPRALRCLGEQLSRSGGAEWALPLLPLLLRVLHTALCALHSTTDALASGEGVAQTAGAGPQPERGAGSSDPRVTEFRGAVAAIINPAWPIIKEWHLQLLLTGRAPQVVHAQQSHSQSLAMVEGATALAATMERLAAKYPLQDMRCAVAYLAAVAVQDTTAERPGAPGLAFAQSLRSALGASSPSSRAEAVNATLKALCAALRVTAPEATMDAELLGSLAADPVVGSCAALAKAMASLEAAWQRAVEANAQWQEPWRAAKSEVLRVWRDRECQKAHFREEHMLRCAKCGRAWKTLQAPEGPLQQLQQCADQYRLQTPLRFFLADELAVSLEREKTPGQVVNMLRLLITQHLSGGISGGEEEPSEQRLLPLEAPQLCPEDFPKN
ncbi:hypothetical protein CYMTET_9517 [Cymbomonas tetramitiformis]|uniref:Uncharacterized protein n=1 Tax=Cymbomonas tetramitiformis TaxID=36881 RepID=A0AAE0GRL9_9CHLO|nr:hypothetical protein CYMTET_9517 [Cymbomonas tetramitiformis]